VAPAFVPPPSLDDGANKPSEGAPEHPTIIATKTEDAT
jgi:hypothetical protein